jgi:hypothetical protein
MVPDASNHDDFELADFSHLTYIVCTASPQTGGTESDTLRRKEA